MPGAERWGWVDVYGGAAYVVACTYVVAGQTAHTLFLHNVGAGLPRDEDATV